MIPANPMQMMQGMMGNVMGNNPMFQMIQMMQGGANPEQVLEQLAPNNPMVQQFLPLVRGKSPQQINTTFRNMCKERGIDADMFDQQCRQRFRMMKNK